jgi:hypothetical protein
LKMLDESDASVPRITWPQITAGALVVAVAALTTLIVVGSINHVDALATIALALAVVTFVTQIVVFIAQTWTTSQLNAETRAFLQELQSSAHGTERALNNHVNKLTDRLLGTLEAPRKEAESGVDLRERVREDVEEALSTRAPQVTDVTAGSSRKASAEDQRVLEDLLTYPSEAEGVESLKLLTQLSPMTVAVLRTFAEDERVNREGGTTPRLYLHPDHPFAEEAIDAGLLEYVGEDRRWARLTEKGRQACRLLLGQANPPDWLRRN